MFGQSPVAHLLPIFGTSSVPERFNYHFALDSFQSSFVDHPTHTWIIHNLHFPGFRVSEFPETWKLPAWESPENWWKPRISKATLLMSLNLPDFGAEKCTSRVIMRNRLDISVVSGGYFRRWWFAKTSTSTSCTSAFPRSARVQAGYNL